ncbi:MAG: ABC transporter permease, partial [Rhodospirillales bacterium]|nr:ABC transporter permease [Rhodospirillales bacterium]
MTDPTLAAAVHRAARGQRLTALLLVGPLLLLLLFSFCFPIASLLGRAIYDPTMADSLPRTAAALQAAPDGVPPDPVFAALAEDLLAAKQDNSLYAVAKTLNSLLPAARSHVLRAGRFLQPGQPATRESMTGADPFWGEPDTWFAIRHGVQRFTTTYLLAAIDLYRAVFVRTFLVAAAVTIATLILGFPLAWMLANLPNRLSGRLIMLVLLPFWTSILVRTAAWTVLLQKYGLLNDLLLWLHVSSDRFDLMYTRTGMIIAMTHIQLPFTLLPIYSAMRTLQPSQMRAAYSLGARPFTAFRRVYLPQVRPGVAAGPLLTLIL